MIGRVAFIRLTRLLVQRTTDLDCIIRLRLIALVSPDTFELSRPADRESKPGEEPSACVGWRWSTAQSDR